MKIKLLFIYCFFHSFLTYGQFNEIHVASSIYDNTTLVKPHILNDSILLQEKTNLLQEKTKGKKNHLKNINESDIKKFFPDSLTLLQRQIEFRLKLCLPLDKLTITSNYGLRSDPINNCNKFHDGIDLRCKNEYVYSMLPAKVKVVHYDKKFGYGNYVILDHGNIECLYGHLSSIFVKEKDVINAGTIIGLSGNTGRTTGPHLHIRLKINNKSVNPLYFIQYIDKTIQKLDNALKIKNNKLSVETLYSILKKERLLYPTIVLSQACLETGYFTSNVCRRYNNLFGLRDPKSGNYYRFETWEDSVKAYRDYVQYKYHGGNYYKFLHDIGYAEDPNYVQKVQSVQKSLQDFLLSFSTNDFK